MSKIVLDSSAWIEYFAGTAKGRVVSTYIKTGELYITGMIVAEVVLKFLKDNQPVDQLIIVFETTALMLNFDIKLGKATAELLIKQRKIKEKFGLADAHVLAAAKLIGGKVITCDNDFKGLAEATVL